MRWWLLLTVGSGCGSSSAPPVPVIDAPPPQIDAGCGAPACSLVTQGGCTMGKKCTWIVDPNELGHGHVSCLTSGATPMGSPCARDMFGGDTCVGGTACHLDQCRPICDPHATNACAPPLTCQTTDLFHMCGSMAPLAGICL